MLDNPGTLVATGSRGLIWPTAGFDPGRLVGHSDYDSFAEHLCPSVPFVLH